MDTQKQTSSMGHWFSWCCTSVWPSAPPSPVHNDECSLSLCPRVPIIPHAPAPPTPQALRPTSLLVSGAEPDGSNGR